MPRSKSGSKKGLGGARRKVEVPAASECTSSTKSSDLTPSSQIEDQPKKDTIPGLQEDVNYGELLRNFLQRPPKDVVNELEAYLATKLQLTESESEECFCSAEEYTYERIMGTLDVIKERMIKEGIPEEEVHKAFRESKLEGILQKRDSYEDLPSCTEPDASESHDPTENETNAVENNENDCLKDDNESDDGFKNKYPPACKTCRMTCCSNCLVPFKNGDKMVKTIISTVLFPSRRSIPPEVALICIFGSINPYIRWMKGVKTKAEPVAVPVLENTELKCSESSEGNTDDEEVSMNAEKRANVESAENPIEKQQNDDPVSLFEEDELPEINEKNWKLIQKKLLEELDMDPFSTTCDPNGKTSGQEEPEKLSVQMMEETFEQFVNDIVEIVETKSAYENLPGFQLCIGCAELITLLFTAWENLCAKKLTEESYYYAVMLGFKHAKKAQEMIFRAPVSSKMHILNAYAREFHPIGCQQQKSSRRGGAKFSVASRKQDLMKSAVGSLQAYLAESFRLVRNDIYPMLKLDEALEQMRFGRSTTTKKGEMEMEAKDDDTGSCSQL